MSFAYDEQEAYEKVREHFTKPGAEYGIVEGQEEVVQCVYRGNGDPASPVRCAFGVLLPDDLYSPSMEGKSLVAFYEFDDELGLGGDSPERREKIAAKKRLRTALNATVFRVDDDPTSLTWLRGLQSLHDEAARSLTSLPDFIVLLDEYAGETGLVVVKPEG